MSAAKSTNPDRQHRRDRREREPSEFTETTLSVDRVTRVVKGGRRMRFRAIVVLGNRKGKVGLGTGKANEVQVAVGKATKAARRAMIRIPLVKGTIPHQVELKFKAAKILIMPASEGTGVIAGGALRVILEHAGVKNVLSKRFGTGNKLVNAQASILALKELKWPGGKVISEEEQAAEEAKKVADAEAVKQGMEVTEISKAEAEERAKRKGSGESEKV